MKARDYALGIFLLLILSPVLYYSVIAGLKIVNLAIEAITGYGVCINGSCHKEYFKFSLLENMAPHWGECDRLVHLYKVNEDSVLNPWIVSRTFQGALSLFLIGIVGFFGTLMFSYEDADAKEPKE